MQLRDWIELSSVFILLLTLFALIRQLKIQNMLANAQILRDRFEMYWRTYEPVSDRQIEELRLNPTDYMTDEKFSEIKDDEAALRRYIMNAQLFEYFAFLYSLKKLGIPDPLGRNWLAHWIEDLSNQREFSDVASYYEKYYPDLAKFVRQVHAKKARK
ncbi:MAG: hypothetical protein AB7U75_02150 [Hyphomicrobiaceae bacterium]